MSENIFYCKFSEISGDRFDPQMILYKKSTTFFKYDTVAFKDLLVKNPMYGANEAGVERTNNEPRYIRITDIDEFGNLKNGLGVTAKNIEKKYFLNENDLLFARSGATVGKAYIHVKKAYDCFFAGYMIKFVVDSKKINPYFIFIYTQLNIYKQWVKAIQRASGQPNINAEEYKSLLIPLPPIKIQEEIINKIQESYVQKKQKEAQAESLLASIDDYLLDELGIKISKNKNSLQTCIFTTQFSEISGSRFDPYYYQNHFIDFFENIHKSPYEVLTLKNITTKITSGITPLSGGEAYVSPDDGIPFIRSGNIDIDGDINFEDLLYIKKEIHNKVMNSSKVLKNDIMIAIVGATIGQIGIYKNDREANINQAIALIRLKEGFNVDYIKEVIKSSIGQFNLNRLKRPVARANINLEEISTMQLIIPPLSKQNEIADHVQVTRIKAKKLQKEAIKILEEAKQVVEKMIVGDLDA